MTRTRSRRDSYIRPPLLAVEPASPRTARRRFRLVLVGVLLLVAIAAYFLAQALLGSGEGNPAVGSTPARGVGSTPPRGVAVAGPSR